jgi:starch synthase
MADVMVRALPELMQRLPHLQFAVLGQGERSLERAMQELATAWPGRLGVQIGYDERRAHMLHAGADILLHGSRFEPCGLTQLYAMRYGTIPVASRVDGLADTIVDYASHDSRDDDCATGFLFDGGDPHDVVHALGRALAAFMHPTSWHALQRNAMNRDCGWQVPASKYRAVYAQPVDARAALGDTRALKTPDRQRTAIANARRRRAESGFSQDVGERARSA